MTDMALFRSIMQEEKREEEEEEEEEEVSGTPEAVEHANLNSSGSVQETPTVKTVQNTQSLTRSLGILGEGLELRTRFASQAPACERSTFMACAVYKRQMWKYYGVPGCCVRAQRCHSQFAR